MPDLDTIVSLCKRRGFIFPGSEVYGGLANCWDYGPLGVELKRNVRNLWWRDVVHRRDDIVGLEAAILMNPKVWEASGHVAGFTDPLVDCKVCRKRFRADQIGDARAESAWYKPVAEALAAAGDAKAVEKALKPLKAVISQRWDALLKEWGLSFSPDQAAKWAERLAAACPFCAGELTAPRKFNLMFKTFLGPAEDSAAVVYLRPETAQGMFVDFPLVLQAARKKLPFGIAQIGKSFRNEVTPGRITFRTVEFEQMEMEFFVRPGTDDEWHRFWCEERRGWYARYGIRAENLRLRAHEKNELAHYAKACADVEYNFPWGWSELEGIANRTDFDLKQHAKASGKDLAYFDEATKEHVVPFVIEPAAGADRAALAFLVDAYHEELAPAAGKEKEDKRVVLKFHPAVAPIKAAILPLLKNRPEIVALARKIKADLLSRFVTVYDDTAAIGRLYRRQDEIGTPLCVTVDVQTVGDAEKGEAGDGQVTVRDRDTMKQIRVPVDRLAAVLQEELDRKGGL